jgi:TolB-like protein
MGAVVTISLGLMLVQKYHSPGAVPMSEPAPTAPREIVPVRLITPGESSLAVLPLQNVSADAETSFARGMTDALIANLAHLDAVRVVSRTSSAAIDTGGRPLPQIARELGVDFIVEGTVTKADGRVRIALSLIDARRDEQLLSTVYDRPLRQTLTVQADVADAMRRAVGEALASQSKTLTDVAARTLNPEP